MIRVKNLAAGYLGTAVLKEINMRVDKGKILGLLGRNGCGKTTLLRSLNGLLKPMKGKVFLDGQDISSMRPEGCHLKAWQSPSAEAMERAGEMAAEIGIAHLLDKQFDRLSGGEQQLVLIARALMQSAPTLFLDEPTSHLDFTNQHMVMNLISALVSSKGVTTIITTHDPNIALQYCDDVMMLQDGKILDTGPVASVLTENNLRSLYGPGIAMEQTATRQVVVPVR